MSKVYLGFGRKEFTPDGPIGMNSRVVGTVVTEPLYVSCIAWREEKTTVLTLSVDLRNMYDVFQIPVREAISEKTGVPFSFIVLAGTHNHSCPDISSFRRLGVKDWYDRIGLPAILSAAEEAIADLSPLKRMVGGETVVEKVAFVRRFLREDGTWKTIGCTPNPSPTVAAESEADPQLRAVRLEREGKKDLILVNFQTHAAHCLSTNPDRISADFVGSMRRVLEEDGDAFSVYFQGACGNVNTFARLPKDKPGWGGTYEWVGERIGNAAKIALSHGKEMKIGPLVYQPGELTCTVNHRKTHLADKVALVRREEDPEQRQKLMEEYGFANRYELTAILERSEFGQTREMPISVFVMGDLAMGITPVELFCSCGKAFREISPYPMTFFIGYANGEHNYLADAPSFPHEGYEVLECHYVPGTGEALALKLGAMLQGIQKETKPL